jgi:transposase
MIGKEEWMEIRILSKQGKSIRDIHRITGHSRTTIRKFLRSAAGPKYKARVKRPGKLDPFKGFLQERVKAALPHRLERLIHKAPVFAWGYLLRCDLPMSLLQKSLSGASKAPPR